MSNNQKVIIRPPKTSAFWIVAISKYFFRKTLFRNNFFLGKRYIENFGRIENLPSLCGLDTWRYLRASIARLKMVKISLLKGNYLNNCSVEIWYILLSYAYVVLRKLVFANLLSFNRCRLWFCSKIKDFSFSFWKSYMVSLISLQPLICLLIN